MNDVKFRVEPRLLSLPSRKDALPGLILEDARQNDCASYVS